MKLVKGAELTAVGTSAQTPSYPTLTLNSGAKYGACLHLHFCSFEVDLLIIPVIVLLFTLSSKLGVDSFQRTLNRNIYSRSTPDPHEPLFQGIKLEQV